MVDVAAGSRESRFERHGGLAIVPGPQAEGEANRRQPDFPPRPAFPDVVRLIERVDDRRDAGGCASDGAPHAEGQQSPILSARNLQHLILDDGESLARGDASQGRRNRVEQIGDWDETDEGDHKEERREQREKKVVRELRGKARQLSATTSAKVRFARSFHPMGMRSPCSIQYVAGLRRPVPVVGVNDGASLAGKDASDAS